MGDVCAEPKDNQAIAKYIAAREEFYLRDDADKLTVHDVLGTNYATQKYLLESLKRDEELARLFLITDDAKKVLPEFKAYFLRQAEEASREAYTVRDFRDATQEELVEGRKVFACMKMLIRRTDKFVADVLKVKESELFDESLVGKPR